MAAMRGCALGRRSAAIRVCARFVSLEPRSAPRAGRSQQGGHRHERAAALGLGGEAAGHARTKANTRRNARGGGLGEGAQPELRANVQQKGAATRRRGNRRASKGKTFAQTPEEFYIQPLAY